PRKVDIRQLEGIGYKIVVTVEGKPLYNRYFFKAGTVLTGSHLRFNIIIDRETNSHRLAPARTSEHRTIVNRILPLIPAGILKAPIETKALVGEIGTIVKIHRRRYHVPYSGQLAFEFLHPIYFR